jgi:hypothetical protein
MSGDVGEGARCHPVIQGFGRVAAGREKTAEFFYCHERSAPAKCRWKFAELQRTRCVSLAMPLANGKKYFDSFFTFSQLHANAS